MSRAQNRKFHYIYKITRTDGSGKFYIGMHSTNNLEDGYFGSGTRLWRSINKHGKEKHSKEILEFSPSRNELKLREKEIVNKEMIGNMLCMNLKLGGEGSWDFVNKTRTREQNIKFGKIGSDLVKEKFKNPEFRENLSCLVS